jgi:hypothetical protein
MDKWPVMNSCINEEERDRRAHREFPTMANVTKEPTPAFSSGSSEPNRRKRGGKRYKLPNPMPPPPSLCTMSGCC